MQEIVQIVRASRIRRCCFDSDVFDSKKVTIPKLIKVVAQKARILLMLALNCTKTMKQLNHSSNIEKQNVFLFGTAGFGKSKEYFEMILKNVQNHLDASNCVKGTWMCQGKMPLAIRAKFESNPEMLKNFDEALKHPNDKDVDSLMKCVNEAL